jgi:hypothetical protein
MRLENGGMEDARLKGGGILWTLFPAWPGICIRCGADVIFKPQGTELNRWGSPRRWRMKNIGGGSHSKSCPVKHLAGPRLRGRVPGGVRLYGFAVGGVRLPE